MILLLLGCAAWIRFPLVGDTAALPAHGAAALAMGVWTGGGRAFEALYLFLWYVGRVNRVPASALAGVTAGSWAMGMPVVYLALTAGLFALALLGRARQVSRQLERLPSLGHHRDDQHQQTEHHDADGYRGHAA